MSIRAFISYLFPICCLSPRARKNQSMKAVDAQPHELAQEKTNTIGVQSLHLIAARQILPPIEECHLPLVAQERFRSNTDIVDKFDKYIRRTNCVLRDYNANKPT